MSGGGSSRPGPTQQTVVSNQLPESIERGIDIGADRAVDLFDAGIGGTPYPGSTYVPPTADEMEGISQIRAFAGNNPFTGPTATQLTGLLNNQGITGDHRSALAPAQRIAQGDINIGTGGAFGNLANQFGKDSYSEKNLTDLRGLHRLHNKFGGQFGDLQDQMGAPLASRHLGAAARGDFLGADGNPHFSQALSDASRDTMQGVNAQMASLGRLGSDAHTGVAADRIGQLQTRARADQHNLERQMQMAAAGQMDQSRMAQGGLLSGILGQRAGLMGQDIQNRMAATGQMDQARMARLQGQQGALQGQTGVEAANIANQGQTALSLGDQHGAGRDAMMRGMALGPALNRARYFDPQQLINAGAGLRGELQDELQSNISRFQGEQNAPWARLGLLTSALQGFPDMSTTTQNTTGTIPRGSPIAGAFGGAATGAGIGGAFGPMGAGIGGGLGLLSGLFM